LLNSAGGNDEERIDYRRKNGEGKEKERNGRSWLVV
jgi:hypothetical protein